MADTIILPGTDIQVELTPRKLCCWCDDVATNYVECCGELDLCCEKHYYEYRYCPKCGHSACSCTN